MTPKPKDYGDQKPRSQFLQFTDKVLRLVDGIKGIAMILAALSVGGASGTLMASDGDTAARMDTLESRVDSLETGFGQMRREAMEMYSAQIEADSTLRVILESRASNRRKAKDALAETKQLFNEITGGNP